MATMTPQQVADSVNAVFADQATFAAFLHIGAVQIEIAQQQGAILAAQTTLAQAQQATNDAIAAAQQQITTLQQQLAGGH